MVTAGAARAGHGSGRTRLGLDTAGAGRGGRWARRGLGATRVRRRLGWAPLGLGTVRAELRDPGDTRIDTDRQRAISVARDSRITVTRT